MSYTLNAVVAKPAPKESFPDGENTQQGWWIPYLIDRYMNPLDHEDTIWDGEIREVYDGLCGDLKEKPEELLEDLRLYDADITLQDVERLRDFLKVCINQGYILNEWY